MSRIVQVAVAAVAVVALAVGIVGWYRYVELSGDGSDNLAVVDTKETAAVQSAVSQALESVLSYNYEDPTTTQAAAEQVLSGDAREEYDTLFKTLEEQAPDQELVLTAQVVSVGVEELEGNSATLLVFVDQSSRRADDDQASLSAAQLQVEAGKESDGTWVITGLTPL